MVLNGPNTVKTNYYADHSRELKRLLGEVVPSDQLRQLHIRRAWRHFLITARQLFLLAAASWGLIHFQSPWIWLPLALVQGFTIFNFTILLHEVVHGTVFDSRKVWWNRWGGHLYAFPSGISASQFTRWHLDHHAELGSATGDPKRFHLSPRINRPWYKFLYFTPALFYIYFRAARREMQTYPVELQRKIRRERNLTLLGHGLLMALIGWSGGLAVLTRVYLVPYFLFFPVAFALNRLGQHYDIDPGDPAKWSTLMKGGRFWDFAYLWSNYHLEHHYFPSVPFYNLARLNALLQPFFESKGLQPRTYRQLLYGYFVENHQPHTDWSQASRLSS